MTLSIDFHHSSPGSRRVADRAGELQLLMEDLINWEPDLATANPHLGIASHGAQRFQAAAHRTLVAGAFEGNVNTQTVGHLVHRIEQTSLTDVSDHGCTEALRSL